MSKFCDLNKILELELNTNLLATPFETSQFSIESALEAASSEPSNTNPKPPFITSPL
jgi:hypothetical protein